MKYALGLLHKLKFVHKDIKPENILYDRIERKFLLADFGLSQFIREEVDEKSSTYFQGTIEYMGPEMKKMFIEDNTEGMK